MTGLLPLGIVGFHEGCAQNLRGVPRPWLCPGTWQTGHIGAPATQTGTLTIGSIGKGFLHGPGRGFSGTDTRKQGLEQGLVEERAYALW